MFIRIFFIQYPMPKTFKAKVINVSENYVIAKTSSGKVLIYGDYDFNFDQTISYSGTYQKIFSPKSKYGFQFDNYMLNNNIKYSIKAKNIKEVKKAKSIRSKLYTKIKKHPDRELLSKLILKINHSDLDFKLLSMIASAGVVIKSLIYFIKKVLSLFFYPKKVFLCELVLLCFFMFIFKHYLFYLNTLFYTLLKKSDLENVDALFISACLILFIDPLYLFSLSFIINFLFRLLPYVSLNKGFRFIEGLIVILPIQLRLFYKADIFSILAYRYYKLLATVAFILAFIDLIFLSRLTKSFISFFDVDLFSFTVSGHLNNLLLFLWIFFSLLALSRNKIFYKLALTFIIFLNQNQLLFNPSLIYTQLYVGQGDCALIRYPFAKDILMIDTGPPNGANRLTAFLNYYGVKEISNLIISHDDLDHSGNKELLKENYLIKNIVEKSAIVKFHKLKLYAENFNMQDINENSLITYFKVNEEVYLSLGDVSKKVEKMFLDKYSNLNPSIVKLAHHGSDTSTSEQLLEEESIKLLLNSSGYNNMYKHPNHLVMSRILNYGLPFIDTQQVGDIEIIHFLSFNFLAY